MVSSRRERMAMSPEEIRAFIRSRGVVILVSSGPDGFPHAIPMGFAAEDDGQILCVSWRKTQKVANLKRKGKAALLFEAGREESNLKAAMVTADVEVIDEPAYTFDVMTRMNEAAGSREAPMPAEKLREIASKRVVLRFSPEKIISWDRSKLSDHH